MCTAPAEWRVLAVGLVAAGVMLGKLVRRYYTDQAGGNEFTWVFSHGLLKFNSGRLYDNEYMRVDGAGS